MYKLIFKHPEQATVYAPLITAINKLCEHYKKSCTCVSGYRSEEAQRKLAQQILKQVSTNYFKFDRVFDFEGRCIVGAPGSSNHNYCLALDIEDSWFKALTNLELVVWGIVKPMAHEKWHVELTATRGMSKVQKETIRDTTLKGDKKDMTTKGFQKMTGLFEDDIAGPITKAKAKEIMLFCQTLLGINVEADLRTVTNIINKLGGK